MPRSGLRTVMEGGPERGSAIPFLANIPPTVSMQSVRPPSHSAAPAFSVQTTKAMFIPKSVPEKWALVLSKVSSVEATLSHVCLPTQK